MAPNTCLRLMSSDRQKSIIAMKGAPFTRKTEFASLIAASLSCPLLSMEDVLDVLHPNHVQISPPPNTLSTPPSQLPHDLAFHIICRMAESHLSNGVSENVVIDSPLSSRSHLDQLVKLASSMPNTRLVVAECKPENTYLWQMKFEQHLHENPHLTRKWYKAQNWDEVIKETIQHEDDDKRSSGYRVSKLILDPLKDYLYSPTSLEMVHPWPDFEPPPFMEAIMYLMTRKEGDGPDVVVYRQWQLNSCTPNADQGSQTKEMEIQKQGLYCRDSHTLTEWMEELGLEYKEVKCKACGKELVKGGGAYACNNCTFALHKECAESFDNNNTWGNPFIKKIPGHVFPHMFDCAFCKENKKNFTSKCASCLFETHLKCRLMPTAIKHGCEEHFLAITLLPTNAYQEVHMCSACGTDVEFIFYTCKICCTYYHFNCLNEIPLQVKHEHGGHHHQLLLNFSSDKSEDYICDECLELRDPEKWFYSCKDCQYYLHLDCVLSKIENGGSWKWQVPA